MTDKTPALPEPPLDEQFDTQMEVERDPCGAWQAIQTLSAQLQEALDRADRAEKLQEEALAERDEMHKQNLDLCRQISGDAERRAHVRSLKDRATTAEAAIEGARKVIEGLAHSVENLHVKIGSPIRPAYNAALAWLSANPEVKG
jgi:hypothetical protein